MKEYILTKWKDARLGSHPVMVMQSLDPKFPFLDETMQQRGLGIEGVRYLDNSAGIKR